MRTVRKTGLANYDGCQLRQKPIIEIASAQGSDIYSAALDCPRTEQSGVRAGGEYAQVSALTELRRLAAVAVCSSCESATMSPTEYIQAQTDYLTAQAGRLAAELHLMEVKQQYEAALKAAEPRPTPITELNADAATIDDTQVIIFAGGNPKTTQPFGSALSEPTMILPQYKHAETESPNTSEAEFTEQPVLPDRAVAFEQGAADAADERTVIIVPPAALLQIEQTPHAEQQ